ncbi:type II secretion system minor pseudopilin GspK [Pseudomonas fontis]|uniref:Type II secretion system protein K n=1 Tax=Pseudomonas fontis TaxID=2942633 RepID=A0ABT5NPX9_9PSED|nr:type II secretion system minor pseudopilin GspK [Pseudomonas fontis]MDD0974709.1 type II secretion system minor pseudopilin GspK [Pseudomonas fontis]MDD0990204.1 type II secretion system minor pseudopilin GspK [Pseudomonas fontis]
MAIISALLIAAVVAVIAGGMISRQSVFTRQLENQQLRAESGWMLRAGLEWSRQLLAEQRQSDPLIRGGQRWAQPLAGVPGGQHKGQFEGRLDDEQGKFNLRNLVADEQVDEQALAAFRRLCSLIDIRPMLVEAIITRVVESYPVRVRRDPPPSSQQAFDSGRLTSPGALNRPLPARRPMLRSLEQLADLPGIDAPALERLRRYVSVVPANTWINGNTAPAEVLAAHVPGLSVQKARSLVAERDGGRWFINRGDFVNRLQMPNIEVESVRIGISSEWFRLQGQVQRAQRRVRVEALLQQVEAPLPRVVWVRVGV